MCVLGSHGCEGEEKVSRELGTVPGMELDFPVLVPELKQFGSARASLLLFMELLFGFWVMCTPFADCSVIPVQFHSEHGKQRQQNKRALMLGSAFVRE